MACGRCAKRVGAFCKARSARLRVDGAVSVHRLWPLAPPLRDGPLLSLLVAAAPRVISARSAARGGLARRKGFDVASLLFNSPHAIDGGMDALDASSVSRDRLPHVDALHDTSIVTVRVSSGGPPRAPRVDTFPDFTLTACRTVPPRCSLTCLCSNAYADNSTPTWQRQPPCLSLDRPRLSDFHGGATSPRGPVWRVRTPLSDHCLFT